MGAELELIARLRNEAKQGLTQLKGDLKDVGKEAENTNRGFGGLGRSLSVAKAGFLAAVGSVSALTGALAYSIGQAAEAEAVQAKLTQTLENLGNNSDVTADRVNEIASSLAAVTTYGDDAIVTGQNMMLQMANLSSDILPAASQAMLDLATKTGSVDSAAQLLGIALAKPEAAAGRLARAGIILSEQEQALIASFVAAGDAAGAQGVILDAVAAKMGGQAAAAAETFTGRMQQLKNMVGEGAEALGSAFLPALTTLAGQALPAVTTAVEELQPLVDELQRSISDLASQVEGTEFAEFAEQLGDTADAMAEVLRFSRQNSEGLGLVRGEVMGMIDPMGRLIDKVGGLIEGFRRFAGMPIPEVMGRIATETLDAGLAIAAMLDDLPILGGLFEKIIEVGNRARGMWERLTPEIEGAEEAIAATNTRSEEMNTILARAYGYTLPETEEAAEGVAVGMEEAAEGTGGFVAEAEKLPPLLALVQERGLRAEEGMMSLAGGVGEANANFIAMKAAADDASGSLGDYYSESDRARGITADFRDEVEKAKRELLGLGPAAEEGASAAGRAAYELYLEAVGAEQAVEDLNTQLDGLAGTYDAEINVDTSGASGAISALQQQINDLLASLEAGEANYEEQYGQGGGDSGGGGGDDGTNYEYQSGGYTGAYGGTVHPNEYVFSPPAVSNLGVDFLEELHQAARSGRQPSMGEFVFAPQVSIVVNGGGPHVAHDVRRAVDEALARAAREAEVKTRGRSF